MELPLCCVLNGLPSDSRGGRYGRGCCGFKLCDPCTDKYTCKNSEIYEKRRCNYIADMHHSFDPSCEDIRDRKLYLINKL